MDVLGLVGSLAMLIVIFGIGMPYVLYLRQVETEHHPWKSWESVAAVNNLKFMPRQFLTGLVSITGTYRSYHLVLQAQPNVNQNTGKNYYHIRLELTNLHTKKDRASLSFQTTESLLATVSRLSTLSGNLTIEFKPLKLIYQDNQRVLEIENAYYQPLFDQLCDLMDAYPHLISAGCEIIPTLQDLAKNKTIEPICHRLIADIATDTKQAFQNQAKEVRCRSCWTVFDKYTIRLSQWNHVTGYACRICGQSAHFLPAEGEVIAVLDREMSDELRREENNLRLNWLQRRTLFDFTAMEIINASDEDVERFAVQVGNDTDEQRPYRRQEIRCTVAKTCHLSENSLRILRKTFGEVIQAG